MAGETFKLNFISNGEGEKVINEPIGFDAIPFTLKQKSKGYARDVFFGGDEENKFKFFNLREHYLETFLYYFETFGWESKVQLTIEKEGIDNIIGDFAFQSAETDLLTYLESKVVQDNNQALLKRRSELNVNLFSESDIDGNEFSGLSTENVLVKSKPSRLRSSWLSTEFFQHTGFSSSVRRLYQNPFNNLENFEINNSLSFIDRFITTNQGQTGSPPEIKDMAYVKAVNNIRNASINLSSIKLSYYVPTGEEFNSNGADSSIGVKPRIQIYVGTDDDFRELSAQIISLDYTLEELGSQSVDRFGFSGNADRYDLSIKDIELQVGEIPRGYSLYVVFFMDRYDTIVDWLDGKLSINVTSVAYNTIVPSIRLYDAVSQVVKSTSGLKTSFPFAEPNGEMYNQRIFNGNLLRNLKERAFNLSLDKIEKWLPEINADYEVNDDTVFFGLYKDYYKNNEIGIFTDVRFDTYKKYFNPRYAINQFNYKYRKFQSQKENEEENSFDISHGDTQWSVLNEYVENKKDINVQFIRDTFLIDEQRRKAFDLNSNTSTQEDETIFIIDTKELSQDLTFSETDFLQHTFDETTNYLKLTNTGNFNFELLGLAVGEDFTISNDDNEGIYSIIEITPRYIVLNNGSGNVNNNGERITAFTYIVSTTTAPYISWSNEGFSVIDGIVDKDDYANLRYTVKRNIKRFYNEYLATCNLFSKKPIKNTEYKNNGELKLVYEGEESTENADFTPTDPILSPYMHDITVITDFNTFMDLQRKVKSDKGFIRCFDANGHVIKIYPQEMTFINNAELGELNIKGEEKYNTSLININTSPNYVIVNNEYTVRKITYKIEGERVYIMDEHGLLMYNPVFWQKVTINGSNPETKEDLEQSLKLLI